MAALVAYRGLILTDNIDDYPDGIILPVDKPYRWTSADVIRKVFGRYFYLNFHCVVRIFSVNY